VSLRLVAQAVGMFAVTNVDDIVILALFFGQASGSRGAIRIVAGQYLGFVAILIATVLGALGAGLLSEAVIPFLGLVLLVLGLRAALRAWRDHRKAKDDRSDDDSPDNRVSEAAGIVQIAAVTLANGGDNIAVYVPVFAVAGAGGMAVYVVVFLAGVAVWCTAGWYFATRPVIAKTLSRWGHLLMPVVLIGIGALILIEGGAFGL
jgi:cadmium resistance protein CadD (predicted permease)